MSASAQTAPLAPMTREELGSLLNVLLEAERAGAKLLAAYLDELPARSDAWTQMNLIQRDEARNCAVLIHFLLQADVLPSPATGDFYQKGLAIQGWRERLEFLNRGQGWVAKRIREALRRMPPSAVRTALASMHDSHLVNIGICQELFR